MKYKPDYYIIIDDYIIIDENIAKQIPLGTTIFVSDDNRSIKFMLIESLQYNFVEINNSESYPIKISNYNNIDDSITRYRYGCVCITLLNINLFDLATSNRR